MYTDGDDISGDGEKNDGFANGDGNEDWENSIGLAAETNIAPLDEETNDSGKIIDISDVIISKEGKRAKKPSMKDIQPPLNKRRRDG